MSIGVGNQILIWLNGAMGSDLDLNFGSTAAV